MEDEKTLFLRSAAAEAEIASKEVAEASHEARKAAKEARKAVREAEKAAKKAAKALQEAAEAKRLLDGAANHQELANVQATRARAYEWCPQRR